MSHPPVLLPCFDVHKVPELREALTSFRPTSNGADGNLAPLFTASLKETFNQMDRSTEAIPPAMFVQVRYARQLKNLVIIEGCHR